MTSSAARKDNNPSGEVAVPGHATVVFEDSGWIDLLPLVYTRACCQLICGTGSLATRVVRLAGRRASVGLWTRAGLAPLVAEETGLPANQPAAGPTLFLNGRVLWHQLPALVAGEGPWVGVIMGRVAAVIADGAMAAALTPAVMLDAQALEHAVAGLPRRDISPLGRLLDRHWHFVMANPAALREDWDRFGPGSRPPDSAPAGVHLLNPCHIHVGPGTRIKPCVVIDAEDGPVHIGRGVRIMPHVYIQGPAFIGDGTLVQTGAAIREGTTIGPVCKIGGEVEDCIIHGHTNKQHNGFLGHSYLGEWINIAADCINSDLKNTYGTVRVPINGHPVESGELLVGASVGDHSKIGINVSIPTGAVVGLNSNVFGAACPKFVPSFMWVEPDKALPYDAEKAIDVARRVMARRKRVLTVAGEHVLREAMALSAKIELQAVIR